MKLKIFSYITLYCTLLLMACQKDIDVFIPDPGQQSSADTNWVSSITNDMPIFQLRKSLALPIHRDSFEMNNINTITLNNPATGISCEIKPYAFAKSFSSTTFASGKLYIDLLLIKKKGDMIRMDKPTVSNGQLLISGGELFVSIMQNNDTMVVRGIGLLPPLTLSYQDSFTNNQMHLFNGNGSNPDLFTWDPDIYSNQNPQFGITASQLGYQIKPRFLNWINCDRFTDTTLPKCSVSIHPLLPNYTNANTTAYIVFESLNSIMKLVGNPATKLFSTQNIPINKPATLIVISKQGNDYFLGKEHITTGVTNGASGILNQMVAMNPTKTTLQNIKDYLATL